MHQSPPNQLLPAISTILTPGERVRVDAAGEGSYRAIHRDGVAELVRRIKSRRAGVDPACWRFSEARFTAPPRLATVRALSREFGVLPSTLMSRFYRTGLPSPKRYLAGARLIRAARLFENPGFSIANVANHLDYSSPQSFGRHVRALLRMTAGEFRTRFDGVAMLQHFRATLVLPYLAELRRLQPVREMPWRAYR